MKTELYFYIQQALRSKLTTAISSLAGLVLLSSVTLVKEPVAKTSLLIGSLAAGVSALTSAKTTKESDDALNDFSVATGLNRQRQLLFNPPRPQPAPSTAHAHDKSKPELFDLNSIGEDRNAFPNLFVIGAPGSGKTTTAEYLGIKLKAGKRYAVHPHAKPTDFKGFDGIFGGGRNIGTPEDALVSWQEIEGRMVIPTVAQVIKALFKLMQDRYLLYYQGQTEFDNIDVYFDEVPALVSELGKEFMRKYIPALIMECRKVGIRLWFLSQGLQLNLLGLEGSSDLREGATVVRLGKLAINQAKLLLKKGLITQEQFAKLSSSQYPILVDDVPSSLPGYTQMLAEISASLRKPEPAPVSAKPKRNRKKSLTP